MAEQEVQNGSRPSELVESQVAVATFSALVPQLLVPATKVVEAVQFYKAAFGAEEVSRKAHPKRKADQELPHIISAQLKVGSTCIVVSESHESVLQIKSGCTFLLETDDVAAAVARAVDAGAMKMSDEDSSVAEGGAYCGGRVGKITDPYGFVFQIYSPPEKTADDVAA